jgi:phytanoyl-CoA hydroxylase
MLSAWLPLDDALVENGCMWCVVIIASNGALYESHTVPLLTLRLMHIRMVPGSHTWGDDDPYRDGIGGTRGIPTKGITGTLEDIFDLNRDGSFSPPPTAAIQEIEAVPREVLRGEVHFHHGLMWHASPRNSSPHGRRGYAIHFMPASTRFFKAGNHLCKQFVPPDLADGSPVALMGDHFPWVCKDGKPVQVKPPQVPNANSPIYNGPVADNKAMGGKRRQWKRDT